MSQSKDDIFSISVTELLLIIMFALLIVMVLLNVTMQEQLDESEKVEAQYQEMTSTLEEITDALGLSTSPKEPASMELTEAVAQMQALVKALESSVKSDKAAQVLAKMKLDDVWSTLTKANSENIEIPELLAAVKKANEALEKCLQELDEAKAMLAQIKDEVKSSERENKELRTEIAKQQEIKKELEEENSNLIGQVENLSNGLEFPPCWANSDGRAQYTYFVEVRDSSLVVTSIYPEERKDAYFKLMATDYAQTELSLKDFNQQLSIFYKDAVNRKPECRYFVKIEDKTSAAAKREYKQGLQVVESIFYKYLVI